MSTLVIAVVVPAVAILLLMVFLYLFMRARRSNRPTTTTTDDLDAERSQLPHPRQTREGQQDLKPLAISLNTSTTINEKVQSCQQRVFTYQELAAATGNFSNANCLGKGGFGEVYKGVLENSQVIAVKKLKYQDDERKEKEFETEILTISRVRHQHLVMLVGYCIDKADRLLVYEFVPKNSLRTHLHGENRTSLNWPTRMRIALGSAKALAYLHEGCKPKIIHRDIKAENILLDQDFEPKIADFGLAKDFSNSVSHISTDPKGTFGYLPPEYAFERKLTDKSDVFSFGIVLLELITGRKPVDGKDNDRVNLAVWVVPQIKQALEDGSYKSLIDPNLLENYDVNEMGRMVSCAAACVYKPAKHRPQMSQIVEALRGNLPSELLWVSNNDTSFLYDGAPYLSFPGGGGGSSEFNSEQYMNSYALESQENSRAEDM
ncbi:proline-rich receptor-like protein kinase PERK15 isoform X1 [Ricinus communis]|uniref:non-specific serine/threonine protein kinase n=1 Tax=Ricinus communis TaxID=3988 RepID=B9RQM8_RICCO|nr:proline-rich receptor-like protein kinase PERK15 isoform X1 [Ricinus communis]EEF46467.1 serine-threonine protein kinase, plant-type, putative [Ricinus communis]|eukprot:XP_002516047.1 proline-rich receptor-like protein kinase PERK15 [Ricinus communis]